MSLTDTNYLDSSKISKSVKAGLHFPVPRIAKLIKQGKFAERLNAKAPVFLTAVLEYLSAEILDIAGDIAKSGNKKRIQPIHISSAVKNDNALLEMLSDVTISSSSDKRVLRNATND